jgi:hypothetical protein
MCGAIALALGDRDFPLSNDLFLAFVWLLVTCLSFYFVCFLFLFSLNWLLVCVINALIKGEMSRMVARKERRSRQSEPVQGSNSQPKSAHGVCGSSPQNRPGYLVEPQNQDWRLGG